MSGLLWMIENPLLSLLAGGCLAAGAAIAVKLGEVFAAPPSLADDDDDIRGI